MVGKDATELTLNWLHAPVHFELETELNFQRTERTELEHELNQQRTELNCELPCLHTDSHTFQTNELNMNCLKPEHLHALQMPAKST